MHMMAMMNNATHGMWNEMMNGMMQMAPWLAVLWLLLQLGVLLLVILGIVWLVRTLRDTSDRSEDSALAILRERYAHGEIDEEEFRERKRQLESE